MLLFKLKIVSFNRSVSFKTKVIFNTIIHYNITAILMQNKIKVISNHIMLLAILEQLENNKLLILK